MKTFVSVHFRKVTIVLFRQNASKQCPLDRNVVPPGSVRKLFWYETMSLKKVFNLIV